MELNNFFYNKIYLGDSYELIKQIPDKSIDLVIMDVPYLIEGLHSGEHGIFKGRNTETRFDIHLMESNLQIGFDYDTFLPELSRVMKKINCYIWCNKELIPPLLDWFLTKSNKSVNFEFMIWYKSNCPPFCGNHYLKDKEYCLYFWETGAHTHIPYERGHTVFLGKVNKHDKDNYGHPTIKPETITEDMILNSSDEGDLVCDFFLGSGTTAVCAKRLNRKYLGFEIMEKWYDIACDRLNGVDKNGQGDIFQLSENSKNLDTVQNSNDDNDVNEKTEQILLF